MTPRLFLGVSWRLPIHLIFWILSIPFLFLGFFFGGLILGGFGSTWWTGVKSTSWSRRWSSPGPPNIPKL